MRSIVHAALYSILPVILAGCVSVKYNYQLTVTQISEPPLNTVVTARVGDNIIRQGKYAEHEGIYVLDNVKLGILGEVTITPGSYLKVGHDAKSEFYRPGGPEPGQVLIDPGADPVEGIRLSKKDGRLCAVATTHVEDCTTKANFEKREYPVQDSRLVLQTLIYSGKIGDKINIGYREFSGDIARPAFNNEVEYDLSESKMIGYKGAKIEVVEATNEHIKYKVISNFNRADF